MYKKYDATISDNEFKFNKQGTYNITLHTEFTRKFGSQQN